MGAVLVAGATSGAGKSTVTSALCRALARRGVDVAPFKAQNMSNHSAVTPDGGELGRAQAMQALAARVDTDRRMGPVLLKPSGMRSHVVVLGDEVGVDDALSYGDRARSLRPVVLEALTSLCRDHAVVVAEGAGGAAEPNLLDRDVVNLPLAAAAGMPAVLVVDIDRGGAFAAAFGTWALLPERLRSCLRGVVLNGMRGDVSLLDPAVRDLEARTGIPVLGVLPHLGEHLMLGVEDSLDLRAAGRPSPEEGPGEGRPLRVGVVALPHLANPSDLDPLVLEPSVELRWATRPGDLHDVDLVLLPGTRATLADLAWLRERGLAEAIVRLAQDPAGPHVLGICGGYQMLGEEIEDDGIEADPHRAPQMVAPAPHRASQMVAPDPHRASQMVAPDPHRASQMVAPRDGVVPGLGLLPVSTRFARPKVVRRVVGRVAGGSSAVSGYQIHLGRVTAQEDAARWLSLDEAGEEGCLSTDHRVRGTTVHGVLDEDTMRHAFLGAVATVRGRDFRPSPVPYAEALDAHLEHLADWVEQHLDVDALLALTQTAAVPGEGPGW
ncbi:cobyric acid synthase [Serinicoccus profundi]|uniref:cobyric acid synthase n=1 Tax=Serinicoccus profundi TaxID=1078471 RepID=UPI000255E298|nr:cobyric acid synthase [Serinicoccus profundi]